MGIYIFSNPEDENDIVEVIMSVHDLHEYSKNGVKWNRVWQNPRVGIDTKLDAFSSKDFVRATSKSKDSLGSLYDRAKEMSIKREDKLGFDPVKEKCYEDYSKLRGKNKIHPEKRKETLEKLKSTPIELKIKKT